LRHLTESDLDAFCRYHSDPEVARYQFWEDYSRKDGIRLLESQRDLEPGVRGPWFQLVIASKATGEVIGDCALRTFESQPQQTEIGFNLDPAHQHKGYAKEAVARLLDYIFTDLKRHRVIAVTDVRNIPTARLLESLGFRREGHFIKNVWFKGAWGDEFLYAMLEDEWAKIRATR